MARFILQESRAALWSRSTKHPPRLVGGPPPSLPPLPLARASRGQLGRYHDTTLYSRPPTCCRNAGYAIADTELHPAASSLYLEPARSSREGCIRHWVPANKEGADMARPGAHCGAPGAMRPTQGCQLSRLTRHPGGGHRLEALQRPRLKGMENLVRGAHARSPGGEKAGASALGHGGGRAYAPTHAHAGSS